LIRYQARSFVGLPQAARRWHRSLIWVDLQLHVVLSMPVAAGDLARAKQRVDMVLATARALQQPVCSRRVIDFACATDPGAHDARE
jgi:hypothetical protein